MIDYKEKSLAALRKMHPILGQEPVESYLENYERLTGVCIPFVTATIRTPGEQAELFKKGRTTMGLPCSCSGKVNGNCSKHPLGMIVTRANAYQSLHNYGLAIDYALIKDGKTLNYEIGKDFDGDGVADFLEIVHVMKQIYGYEWAGDWNTFKEYPHFQKSFGFSPNELERRVKAGITLPGTNYVKLS